MKQFVKNAWLKTKQVAENCYNKVRNYFVKPSVAATGASLVIVSASASAAVPADVTTAITTAVTDVGVIGAAILGVVVAIVAFAWLRRVIK